MSGQAQQYQQQQAYPQEQQAIANLQLQRDLFQELQVRQRIIFLVLTPDRQILFLQKYPQMQELQQVLTNEQDIHGQFQKLQDSQRNIFESITPDLRDQLLKRMVDEYSQYNQHFAAQPQRPIVMPPTTRTEASQTTLLIQRSNAFHELVSVANRRLNRMPDRMTQLATTKQLIPHLHPAWSPSAATLESTQFMVRFFTQYTSSSFNVDPTDHQISGELLSTAVHQYGNCSTSLMNSMYAITALHMKHMKVSFNHDLIFEYTGVALAQFNADMKIADPETFQYLLVNSLLMTAISSEGFRDDTAEDQLYILYWMRVWRGIGIMIERATVQRLIKTGMSKLFYRPPLNLDHGRFYIPYNLWNMVYNYQDGDLAINNRDIYIKTLPYLGSPYEHLRKDLGPMMRLRIITWFTFLPSDFIELAAQKDPRSLVIICHYAVFLKLTTRVWWMENVGQKTISDILNFLGSSFSEFVDVPRAALATDDVQEISRLLTDNPQWVEGQWPFPGMVRPFWEQREDFVDDRGRLIVPELPAYAMDQETGLPLPAV